MDSTPEKDVNPYASPTPTPPSYNAGADAADAAMRVIELRKLMEKFRQQILALGVLWVLFGVIAVGLAIFLLMTTDPAMAFKVGTSTVPVMGFGIVLLGIGSLWMLSGVGSLLKQMWAVYTGLVLTYISLINSALSLNICSGIIALLIVIQAHRVLKFAGQLRQLGIPLTANPNELQ